MTEIHRSEHARRTEFLGREFLTWMMARSARDRESFTLPSGETFDVVFERVVTLDGQNPAKDRSVLKVDEPTESEEVRLSLRLGKQVSVARVNLIHEGREFHLTIHGADLGLRGIRLPDTEGDDPDAAMSFRMDLCDQVEALVQGLFLSFVRIRLDPEAWERELASIGRWVDNLPETDAGDEEA
ncbi:MAG TPA: hypothetical protein PLQ97_00385 [Myxococcota bacterium]|nr:hypothetical protein [Myxococcota bacterium]HQK49631.1 hypothetical protein [Myxococcota bacterium]